MSSIIELDDEIERDFEGSGDILFTRVGDHVPLSPDSSAFDLSDPPSCPIAFSDGSHLLFIAHPQGFLVAKPQDVVKLAKEIKDKGKGPSVMDSCIVDVRIGRVSNLALSDDSSVLAATVAGDIFFYTVASLRNKESEACFSCSVKSGDVKDFKWKNSVEKCFIILSSHGSLHIGYMESQLTDVMEDVDAVDWSAEGDFIAVARKNTLSILSPNQKEQLKMSLLFQSWSADNDPQSSIKVDCIKWVCDDSIVVGCVRVHEDGKEEGYLVQVITTGGQAFKKVLVTKWQLMDRKVKMAGSAILTPALWEQSFKHFCNNLAKDDEKMWSQYISSKPVVFSFPDLFEEISEDMLPVGSGPYLLVNYLEPWGLALVSTKKAIGAHLLLLRWSMENGRREAVSLEFEDELYTPRIDLQENGDENLILGFVVDKYSGLEKVRVKVQADYKELLPRYLLWCLTSEGKLILFHIMRTSDPPDLPQVGYSCGGHNDVEKSSVAISLNHQLPARTLSLEDHTEGVVPGKESKAFGSFDTSKIGSDSMFIGKKDQGTADLHAEVYDGQSLKIAQLPLMPSHMQNSGLTLSNNRKEGHERLGFSSAGNSVGITPSVGNLSGGALPTRHPGSKVLEKGYVKELTGSTSHLEASLGSQSIKLPFSTDNLNSKSLSSISNRSVLSDTREVAKIGAGNKLHSHLHDSIYDDIPSGGKFLGMKESSSLPSTLMFSENKVSQSEGLVPTVVRTRNAESLPASCGSAPFSKQNSLHGKSPDSGVQSSVNNLRNHKSPWMVASQPELSKQFYNVKDMAKELDVLLSFIEREGGFRDACTIFQESSLLALEDGLQNLSEICCMHKDKTEEQYGAIQQLQDKMLQVSTRKLYVDAVVKQATNDQYWDIWKQQKLNPELELKRQHIFDTNQSLTSQLIEMERHFNTLEISKFGECGGARTGRRAFQSNVELSRQVQSIQRLYNTVNSQLAASEQLSGHLSKQMAMLNINPPAARHPNVMKELFESIGLPHEASAFSSPDVKGHGHTPNSSKRISTSASTTKEGRKMYASNTSKFLESGSTRRRRDSLDKSINKFEPQRTVVKRMLTEEGFEVVADKHAGISQEVLQTQTAGNATDLKMGIRGKSSKAVEPQPVSAVKWTAELMGLSQNMKSEFHPVQAMEGKASHSSQSPLVSSSSNAQNIANRNFVSPDRLTDGVAHTVYQQDSLMFGTVQSSRNIANLPPDVSNPAQASVRYLSDHSNVKSTLPSQRVHVEEQTNEPLSQKPVEDGLTKLSPKSPKHLGVSQKNLFSVSNESNASSLSLFSSAPSFGASRVAQIDSLPCQSKTEESILSVAFESTPGSLLPSIVSTSTSTLFSSMTIASASSTSSSTSSTIGSSQESSLDTKHIGIQVASAPDSFSSPRPFITQPQQAPLSSSSLFSSETTASVILPLQTNVAKPSSEPAPLQASTCLPQTTEVRTPPKQAMSQAAAGEVSVGLAPRKEPSVISTERVSAFPAASNVPEILSAAVSPLNTAVAGKDDIVDLGSPQEDEMEEEAPILSNSLNLGALDSFGLGSTPPTSLPKPNPFGGSFGTVPASSPFPFTSSPGELFRPASFSLPSAKPMEPSQPMNKAANSGGFGGGFTGFGQPAQVGSGQPAQVGAGQQALGSVLGAFGQSRQLGAGVPGMGFTPSGGFGGGGFSPASNGGVGFPSAGSGFASASAGGFAAVASTAGGGFAGAAAGGGFAGAAAGGGFAAAANKTGGFAAAASAGGGFGGSGFTAGGFGAFSGNQGGGFSSFGGNNTGGAGRPPAELLMQMRK